jgi:TetR/AcrR family transcriptional repressor of bet genes
MSANAILTDRNAGIGSAPKHRTRRSPTQAREHILNKAEEALAEKGIRAVSLADIAARAGYSRGTLLVYFGSVARIQEALFKRMVRRLAAQLAGLPRDRPPEEHAHAVAKTIFKALSSRSQALLVAWLELSAQPQVLSMLRSAIGSEFDALDSHHPEIADVLKDRILISIVLAIGAGLGSQSIADSVGRSRSSLRVLMEGLLHDVAAGLHGRSAPRDTR